MSERLASTRVGRGSPGLLKAGVVQHRGRTFRSASLSAHVAYLERDGVTRGGEKAHLFGATEDRADAMAFAGRGLDDFVDRSAPAKKRRGKLARFSRRGDGIGAHVSLLGARGCGRRSIVTL
jgi:hypothetical protein